MALIRFKNVCEQSELLNNIQKGQKIVQLPFRVTAYTLYMYVPSALISKSSFNKEYGIL
jgi:hypothetical protein